MKEWSKSYILNANLLLNNEFREHQMPPEQVINIKLIVA